MSDNTTRPSDDTSWGPKHIAHHLDVSERHVHDIRREDETFPPPRMVGSKPRWSPDVIRRWVADGGGPTRPPAGPTRVQEWLGHANLSTTTDTYVHKPRGDDSHVREATRRLPGRPTGE